MPDILLYLFNTIGLTAHDQVQTLNIFFPTDILKIILQLAILIYIQEKMLYNLEEAFPRHLWPHKDSGVKDLLYSLQPLCT